eukprot:963785-Pleurochrysis_carterae.AAC.1
MTGLWPHSGTEPLGRAEHVHLWVRDHAEHLRGDTAKSVPASKEEALAEERVRSPCLPLGGETKARTRARATKRVGEKEDAKRKR